MIASIEASAGCPGPSRLPRAKRSVGKPTIINNVETLAHVSRIINEARGLPQHRTPDSPGTKTFALTGHVSNTGLVEVVRNNAARDRLQHRGGVTDDAGKIWKSGFKAVQIGALPVDADEDHLDLPLAYESLRSVGAMVGSGGWWQ